MKKWIKHQNARNKFIILLYIQGNIYRFDLEVLLSQQSSSLSKSLYQKVTVIEPATFINVLFIGFVITQIEWTISWGKWEYWTVQTKKFIQHEKEYTGMHYLG